jgi:hypothetical protein
MSYAVDRLSPARHVAAELGRAWPEALPFAEVAGSYRHPNTGDLHRVRMHERTDKPEAVLIFRAITDLKDQVRITRGLVHFAEGSNPGNLTFGGEPLRPARNSTIKLGNAFDPNTGIFSRGLREATSRTFSDPELLESMRAFGWLPEFPAIKDERGVVLTGSRRLKAAARLSEEGIHIEPQWLTVNIGSGDEADARRFAITVASNLGRKPFSPGERERLAEYLYGDRNWDVGRIGQALGVSLATVYRDLNHRNSHGENSGSDFHIPPRRGAKKAVKDIDAHPELKAEITGAILAGKVVDRRGLAVKYGVTYNLIGRMSEITEAELRERARVLAEVRAAAQEEPVPLPAGSPAFMEMREKVRKAIGILQAQGEVLSAQAVGTVVGRVTAGGGGNTVERAWDSLASDGLAPPRPLTGGNPAHIHSWVCDGCGENFRAR